jgi:hypothetical protein
MGVVLTPLGCSTTVVTVAVDLRPILTTIRPMGFNRRKIEADRKARADKEAAARRATDAQVLEDAERLVDDWNERQARRMPLLFSPTIGAAIAARYWFLWVRCPACRTINAIDLRTSPGRPKPVALSAVNDPWTLYGCAKLSTEFR